MNRLAQGIAAAAISVATALVIVAVAIVPFLSPAWVSFEQDRAEATAWTGYTPAELRTATDGILADLVVGPPAFDIEVGGEPVLNERERSHMRDVRGVFGGFAGLALVAAAILATAGTVAARRGEAARRAAWSSVARGAGGLAIGVVAAGALALTSFDALFEAFHRLFFAGGSYTFDPRSERLVQLFPFRLWQETAIAVGALIVAVSSLVWAVARRQAHPVKQPGGGIVLPAGQRAR